MLKLQIVSLFLIFGSSLAWSAGSPKEVDAVDGFFTRMKKAVGSLTDYSFVQVRQERFKDGMGPLVKMKVKYSKDRFYVKMLEGPKKNAEVLYSPFWNNGKAKVHKGSFPDITVNLDPHGSILLENEHHPIEDLPLNKLVHFLTSNVQNCKKFPESSGRIIKDGKEKGLIQVELLAPWKEKVEVLQKEIDIWSFSQQVHSDPFLILYTNGLEYGDRLSEGASIKVPLCYATRTLLSVDAQTYLPRKLEAYDGQGRLYESYEWNEMEIAPSFTDLDFDPDNKQYQF